MDDASDQEARRRDDARIEGDRQRQQEIADALRESTEAAAQREIARLEEQNRGIEREQNSRNGADLGRD